jgi:iron-sulfur cluster repair protein YtfE (RIC family)
MRRRSGSRSAGIVSVMSAAERGAAEETGRDDSEHSDTQQTGGLTMSSEPTEAFREEHRQLLEHIEHIRSTARELPDLSEDERGSRRARILDFLEHTLIPHAEAEEEFLYPEIGRLLGDSRATDTMSYDHGAIGRRIEQLERADVTDTQALEELLYGLYALIIVHFAKEEDVYLPMLAAEPEEEVRGLFERMAASGQGGHSH